MVYPSLNVAPLPHSDMPEEVKIIFEEARKISQYSARAAAGLLRVCVEKLTEELGEKDGKLNTRIANLVKNGLQLEIQRALDVVRVIGNNELHPGQIDMNDTKTTLYLLFDIVNNTVQRMITDKNALTKMVCVHVVPRKTRNVTKAHQIRV